MRRTLLALVVTLLALIPASARAAAAADWDRLAATSALPVELERGPGGEATWLAGAFPTGARAGAAPVEAADVFVRANASLLGLPPALALEPYHVRASLTGDHVRFRPRWRGVELLDADVAVHFLGGGDARRVRLVQSAAFSPAGLDLRPRVPRERALTAALDAAGAPPLAPPELSLAIVRAGGAPRLAWRVVVSTDGPRHDWDLRVDAATGAILEARDLVRRATGTGMVWDTNPVAMTGDATLTDMNDADQPALTASLVPRPLLGLDGTGVLRGDLVDSKPLDPQQRANEPSLAFDYTRSDDRFEEVMGYYTIDTTRRYIQSLGVMGIMTGRPFQVYVNALAADQSFYSARSVGGPAINMGSGGVDDAEDGDILNHEFGHAVQDDQVPGFGANAQAGALGEGFGDFQAGTLSARNFDRVPAECVGPWDATSYDSGSPPCLRRLDGRKHFPEFLDGEVHDDGEIWSAALWQLSSTIGRAEVYRLVLEMQFRMMPNTGFRDAARLLVQTDVDLNAGANFFFLRKWLTWFGALNDVSAPDPFTGGTITQYAANVESVHNYARFIDQVRTIVAPAGTQAVRPHFAALSLGAGDFVYVYDVFGTLYAVYQGTAPGPFDGPAVPGSVVQIRLVTNMTGSGYGFLVDGYDTLAGAAPRPDGGGGFSLDGPRSDSGFPDGGATDGARADARGDATGGGDAGADARSGVDAMEPAKADAALGTDAGGGAGAGQAASGGCSTEGRPAGGAAGACSALAALAAACRVGRRRRRQPR